MAEWHVPPDYIVDHWTDELFDLMVGKLIARREREMGTMKAKQSSPVSTPVSTTRITDKEHMAMLGKKINMETK